MELYGSFTSPFVRHCRIALLETEIPCDFVEADAAISAEKSPTKKVPFLIDGDLLLSDSSSIIRYIREQANQTFLPTCIDLDLYCLVNTGMDTEINIFLMEKGGIDVNDNPYLQRHKSRVTTTLEALEQAGLSQLEANNDVHWRLACFLDWGLFRERFTIDAYPMLQAFLDSARKNSIFDKTAPPRA